MFIVFSIVIITLSSSPFLNLSKPFSLFQPSVQVVAASDTASTNTYCPKVEVQILKPGIWSDVELLKQRNRRQDNDVQKRLAMISYDDHDGGDEHDDDDDHDHGDDSAVH